MENMEYEFSVTRHNARGHNAHGRYVAPKMDIKPVGVIFNLKIHKACGLYVASVVGVMSIIGVT